jgi:hypothetical protein
MGTSPDESGTDPEPSERASESPSQATHHIDSRAAQNCSRTATQVGEAEGADREESRVTNVVEVFAR